MYLYDAHSLTSSSLCDRSTRLAAKRQMKQNDTHAHKKESLHQNHQYPYFIWACVPSQKTLNLCSSHGGQRSSLSINALRACVYIYIRQLSSFRAHTLWFINLTVATCHIQYTFLSLCQFVSRENGQNTRILQVRHFCIIRRLVGAQSINTERGS